MFKILHRGNRFGPNPQMENRPSYLQQGINAGFHVKADVWYISGNYYLGNAKPEYLVVKSFLQRPEIWAHAKNISALAMMLSDNIHCFFHQNDDVTLTSKGYIWTFPEKILTVKSIAVVLNKDIGSGLKSNLAIAAGICSDWFE